MPAADRHKEVIILLLLLFLWQNKL